MAVKVAALYVMSDGPYAGLEDVEIWDKERDARLYPGPHPVVAHPPCERWGRFATARKSSGEVGVKGADGGCFISALQAVRKFGGVLEHPAASSAWRAFGLRIPARSGGWEVSDWQGGWVCCVDQGFYGHRAQKATWLYAVGCTLPSLIWGKKPGIAASDEPFKTEYERRRAVKTGICQLLSKRQRTETPKAFRDLLIEMARSVKSLSGGDDV